MLDSLNISHLQNKRYTRSAAGKDNCNGGAALAQEPQLLIMDEPTANLDFGNQIRVLEEIRIYRRRGLEF
jgi:iron complex transport system ATP-binding protein